jgi:hypothetical protein
MIRTRTRGRLLLLTLLVVATGGLTQLSVPVRADPGADYFVETGFWVDSRFADFWWANGGAQTFGYPITRVFYEDGLHRQYFERAVFEHHENNPAPYDVLLLRLGAQRTLGRGNEAPFQWQPDNGSGRYFAETGHNLAPPFLNYWEARGGVQAFGYPISEMFVESSPDDGVQRQVQYFERARMEFHEELAGGEFEIQLGRLGAEELASHQVPPAAVQPQANAEADRDEPVIGPTALLPDRPLACGFNFAPWLDSGNDFTNQVFLDIPRYSACNWVRVQFTWSDLQPTPDQVLEERIKPYDRLIEIASERGIRLLINVSHPPGWAKPSDPSQIADPGAFAALMGWLAQRYAGRVAAWQLWNEPNLVAETNGRIDPRGYYDLVKAAAPAVKSADPEARVVTAGLAPNSLMDEQLAMDDDWYLESLLSYDGGAIIGLVDVFSFHAYGAGNDPDHYFPSNLDDNPGWVDAPEFYFRHLEEEHRVLEAHGAGDKPVWITEFGWPVGGDQPVFGYGAWVTEDLQAQYVSRALEIARTEWEWVELVFVWHLNAAPYGGPSSPFAGFSLTRADHSRRPALDALLTLTAAWPK